MHLYFSKSQDVTIGVSSPKLIEEALPAYRVDRELASGGFSSVWLGHHRQLGRRVAIKQLSALFASDASVRRRFRSEARILSSLDNPHVVPIHDFVEQEGLCLLVMEHLDGGTLLDRQSTGLLSIADACATVLAASAALADAHSLGVLHRDVKPRNVLFTSRDVVKIVDFGIAKVVGGSGSLATQSGQILGSPAYMAPEQVLGDKPTPATDVYSLATVLYELLSGSLPFPDITDRVDLLIARVREEPRPLADHPEVPKALAELVDRALAREPANRLEDAETFGIALANACKDSFGEGWLEMSSVEVFARRKLRRVLDGSGSKSDQPGSTLLISSALSSNADHPLKVQTSELRVLVPIYELIKVGDGDDAQTITTEDLAGGEGHAEGPHLVSVVFEISEPGHDSRRLSVGLPVEIGRKGRDVSISDEEASRRHFHILLSDKGEPVIEDLGSTNGTIVNGSEIIDTHPLRVGDLIEAGNTSIRVVDIKASAEAGTAPTDQGTDEPRQHPSAPPTVPIAKSWPTIRFAGGEVRFAPQGVPEAFAPGVASAADDGLRRLASMGWPLPAAPVLIDMVDPFIEGASGFVDGILTGSAGNRLALIASAEAPPDPVVAGLALLCARQLAAGPLLSALAFGFGLLLGDAPDLGCPQRTATSIEDLLAPNRIGHWVIASRSFAGFLAARAGMESVGRFMMDATPSELDTSARRWLGAPLDQLLEAWKASHQPEAALTWPYPHKVPLPVRSVDQVEAFHRLAPFASLPRSLAAEISARARPGLLEPGAVAGDSGWIGIVTAGSAEVTVASGSNAGLVIARVEAGDGFGVSAALGSPRGTQLRATTSTELAVLDGDNLSSSLAQAATTGIEGPSIAEPLGEPGAQDPSGGRPMQWRASALWDWTIQASPGTNS